MSSKFIFTIYCHHCQKEFKTKELSLPFKTSDLQQHECYSPGDLIIKNIKEHLYCNCERCTGIPSIESYYKDEE